MSKIKLPHSSGNSVSIAAPQSNPASDRTLYLPSNADGTVLTNTTPGCILQVTNTTVTAIDQYSCSSAWVDTLLTSSLTPSTSSNKILISMSATGEGNAANQQRFSYRIKKAISGGATTYLTGAAAGSRTLITGYTGDLTDNATTTASSFSISNYLDSPSTTSAVTYTIQLTYENAGGAGTYYLNRQVTDTDASANSRFISWITLMEVAG